MKAILKYLRPRRGDGYTLIELLVVIAILGAITGTLAMTINMALTITAMNTSQSILLSQVHLGSSWIAKDVASADSVTPGDNITTLLYLTRHKWNGADNITNNTTITYSVDNQSNLLRNGAIVAQFIKKWSVTDPYTSFTSVKPTPTENNTYLLQLEANQGTSYYNQQFKIYQRSP